MQRRRVHRGSRSRAVNSSGGGGAINGRARAVGCSRRGRGGPPARSDGVCVVYTFQCCQVYTCTCICMVGRPGQTSALARRWPCKVDLLLLLFFFFVRFPWKLSQFAIIMCTRKMTMSAVFAGKISRRYLYYSIPSSFPSHNSCYTLNHGN